MIPKKVATTPTDIREFLEHHPVFTLEEFRKDFSILNGGREASDMIQYNKSMGRLGMIKEGLYYAIRPGQSAQTAPVDPFLLASNLAPDAVLSYHTALDLLGFGHSVFNTYYCFSNRFRPALRFRRDHFRVVVTPEKLQKKSQQLFGTEKVERLGVKLVVTGKERTLVECLEKPQNCGGFEEMYRSLEKIPFIRPDVLIQYLDLREQKNLYARVGFFLEQHPEDLHIEDSLLRQLAQSVPAQPVYWTPQSKGGVLVKPWNLIVPEAVRDRSWQER
ncbi:MAG TPA: type IV toxin-antitoxin system AbiEi family antitoxin [Bacteroidota bacterium]